MLNKNESFDALIKDYQITSSHSTFKVINKNKEYLMKIENTSENHAINKNSTN